MKKGLILILLAALISGVSIFVNAFGVKGIDAALFTFSKNLVVGLFILALIFGIKEFHTLTKLTKMDWIKLLTIGLIGGSIPFVIFFKGLQLSSGATGSFIHKMMFIFVAVLAVIFLREKLSKKILVPASLLLAGNFLLLKITLPIFNAGTLLIFAATLFWAVENVISKHALKKLSGNAVAFGRMFFGSMFILAYMLFTDKISLLASLSFSQIGWVLITSIFLAGFVLTYYNGLKTVNVTTAASILLLGSPITTMLSFVFLGSALTLMEGAGMLLVLIGVISMILLTEKRIYSTISTA